MLLGLTPGDLDLGLAVIEMVRNLPRTWLLAGVLTVALGGVGTWVYLYFFDMYHFAVVQEKVLYRDGVKTMRQFLMAMDRSRAHTVVMLIDDNEMGKEPFKSEWAYFQRTPKVFPALIPVKLGGFPTTADVRKFLDEVEKNRVRNRSVLVHCAQGIRRTGMMVAAYQMSVMGYDKERAKKELLAFGHSERTINDIKKFIDVYDPEKREVTQDLGMGYEK